MEKVVKVFTVFTTGTLLLGVIKQYFYYGTFGINIGFYASWQEQLLFFFNDIFNYIFVFASMFALYFIMTSSPYYEEDIDKGNKGVSSFNHFIYTKGKAILFGLILVICIFALVSQMIKIMRDVHNYDILVLMLLLIIASSFTVFISDLKSLKPKRMLEIIVFFMIIVYQQASFGLSSALDIKNKPNEIHYKVTTSTEEFSEQNNAYLIGKTNEYTFILDSSDIVQIIPNRYIEKYRIYR